jgi:hypothetical protein
MQEPMVGTTSRKIAVALFATLAALPGCGASSQEVHAAMNSGYNADFAVVYAQALDAVRELYPELVEDAKAGVIKTAWHPIKISQESDPTTSHGPSSMGGPGTVGMKRYFIRFTVKVVGQRPWRVRVEGQASSWTTGQVPTPLKGAEVPAWLSGRSDALRVEIHHRLQQYAVPMADAPAKKVAQKQETTELVASKYEGVPAAATAVIRIVHQAAAARELPVLRVNMTEEFAYSLGGAGGSADVALAVWQADPGTFTELVRVLEAGCHKGENDKLVTCPLEYQQGEGFRGYRAGFEQKDGKWKLAFFFTDG